MLDIDSEFSMGLSEFDSIEFYPYDPIEKSGRMEPLEEELFLVNTALQEAVSRNEINLIAPLPNGSFLYRSLKPTGINVEWKYSESSILGLKVGVMTIIQKNEGCLELYAVSPSGRISVVSPVTLNYLKIKNGDFR